MKLKQNDYSEKKKSMSSWLKLDQTSTSDLLKIQTTQ